MGTTTVSQNVTRGGGFLIAASRPEDIFTPADLNDDQKLIGQTAEEFVEKEVLPLVPELEQHKEGLMPQLVKKAGELGLLGGGVPEEYGGTGLDKVSATILAEKLSGYASFAVTHGGHAGIGTVPIVYFGTEEQMRKYLPKIATGEWISCYCLSEPQAGSDSLAARTRAVLSPDGKHWVLNGQKMWITNGGFADVYVVFAKVDGEKFSCFIVERNYPGFTVGAEERKMGIKGSSTVPIFFENCQVPKENLLHEFGRGLIVAFNTVNVGRFSLGAYCLGGSKNVLEAASNYSKERTAFGKSLSKFGLIQAKLAEMAIRTYAVESMIYRSAGMIEGAVSAAHGDRAKLVVEVREEYACESSNSKVIGSEVVDYCVDEAVQIFGGYGFHEDYPVARAYRDSRINRIFEGTNEINRMLIVQMLMKRAMAGALPLIPAAMKLGEEVLSGTAMEETADGPFAEEERSVAMGKKIFLQASGAAVQRFREKLADEQEIVAALSNIVMEVYAMESCLRRAQKAAAARSEGGITGVMGDAARAFIYDAAGRVEREARTALAATAEGDMLRTQLSVLRRFAKREPVDSIALRRRVAAAVLAGDRYPFEGR